MQHEQVYNSPLIKERLQLEAEVDGDEAPSRPLYWATFQLPNREIHTTQNFAASPLNALPHEMQMMFAKDMLKALNTEVRNEGAWIVGYTHPPAAGEILRVDGDNAWDRLFAIWLDKDGDPQFTVENIRWLFSAILEAGVEFWVKQGAMCYEQWYHLTHEVLDVSEKDTYKRALGEKRPSSN